jgi:hypothetical protein
MIEYNIYMTLIRRIQNKDGGIIDVRPSPDNPINEIALIAHNEESFKYWGFEEKIINVEYAKLIAEALLKCCSEIQDRKKELEQ